MVRFYDHRCLVALFLSRNRDSNFITSNLFFKNTSLVKKCFHNCVLNIKFIREVITDIYRDVSCFSTFHLISVAVDARLSFR